ncbi:MAG: RDD family protein [Marmoricola sp.]
MAENVAETHSSLEVASWARRIGARVIDGVAGALVTIAVLGYDDYLRYNFAPLIVFFAQTALGTMTVGGSFGQMLTRIRVLRTDGRRLGPLAAMLRTALVCVVIPPLVFRPDGRGLHDLATDSGSYRLPVAH